VLTVLRGAPSTRQFFVSWRGDAAIDTQEASVSAIALAPRGADFVSQNGAADARMRLSVLRRAASLVPQ
jgi:hypothetical protein